jgi:ribonuclease D
VARTRNRDELWRIRGSGSLRGRAAAVLRALWQWREKEAEMADRPAFHILRNEELLKAALIFTSGRVPDFKHFSFRRREAFRAAAERALWAPESEWPVLRRSYGTRPGAETIQRTEVLLGRRNKFAEELGLEPSFVAARSALEAIAADHTRASALLVPWQREVISV